jgi:UDP-N-acetylmuramoyl-tripeptide--D-alanyl-D-alanine ligase
VPLTLLSAALDHDFVVAELGTNHPGEIASLAELARPDALVMTTNGREHLAFFGSVASVAAEEAAALDHVRPGGLIAISDQALAAMIEHEQLADRHPLMDRCRVIVYGPQAQRAAASAGHAPVSAMPIDDLADDAVLGGWCMTISGARFDVPLLGRHNAINAAAAVVVGRWLGMSDAALARGLRAAEPMAMRMQQVRIGPPGRGVVVINDAYNANPDSMTEALHQLAAMSTPVGGRRVAVLGDMLELGEQGPALHTAIGKLIADLPGRSTPPVDLVIAIGPLAEHITRALEQSGWDATRLATFAALDERTGDRIAGMCQAGDVVLCKASRGIGLERLLPAMERRFSG